MLLMVDSSGKLTPLQAAAITWRNGVPYSAQFDDIYFSVADGLRETEYVFLNGNRLAERWVDLAAKHFVIGETGFGAGLNFLSACRLWSELSQPEQILHYYTVEKYPLMVSDLQKSLSMFPQLSEYTKELIRVYPPLVPGLHRLVLFDGRVCLTLAFADIFKWLNNIRIQADAWFLDGFAPARNADMWAPDALQKVGENTKEGGSFGTFTVAGSVRRGLKSAGFDVIKRPGFGEKREALGGFYRGSAQTVQYSVEAKPWFIDSGCHLAGRTVTVIGAGLAGMFTADSLARRGWKVNILEKNSAIKPAEAADTASVIFSKFSAYDGLEYRFYRHGYLYSVTRLPQLLQGCDAWRQCGMLQLAHDEKETDRHNQLIDCGVWPADIFQVVNADQASALAGIEISMGGLFFKDSGWVQPYKVCEFLLNRHPGISIRYGAAAKSLHYSEDEKWEVYDKAGNLLSCSDAVVIANAGDALRFKQLSYLPLQRIRGQASQVSATHSSTALRTIICYDGYVTPAVPINNNEHTVGATYGQHDSDSNTRVEDDRQNLQRLMDSIPSLYRLLQSDDDKPEICGARVGFRCRSPDYLPVVGPVPDMAYFEQEYQGLRTGKLKSQFAPGCFLPGLYVNVAHGSRGVTTAPLAAEIIAGYMENEPCAVEEALRYAVHPARFIIRSIQHRHKQSETG